MTNPVQENKHFILEISPPGTEGVTPIEILAEILARWMLEKKEGNE